MLVYGDPQFSSSLSALQSRLAQEIEAAMPNCLDDIRRVLIQCGQLEQAVADAFEQERLGNSIYVEQAQRLTDSAAQAFYAAFRETANGFSSAPMHAAHALNLSSRCLRQLVSPGAELKVKVPEGFAFYGLFPEQYCAAALGWSAQQQSISSRRVLVVGIRSIGTTLSAVIAVTLQAMGWEAHRLTVRPSGDPLCRIVHFCEPLFAAERVIVVDEGPGISGSSMSATVDALVEAGFTKNQITFFPGHDRGPGSAASGSVLANWRGIRQFYVSLQELQWSGIGLATELASHASELIDKPCAHARNIDRGAWRQEHYERDSDWPAASALFERMKWRCCSDSGESVFWKFVGLGPWLNGSRHSVQNAWHHLEKRADQHWSPHPLATFRGFVAMPWVEGRPLRNADFCNSELCRRIAMYLVGTSGPALSQSEWDHAVERLRSIVRRNTEISLGDSFRRLASRCIKKSWNLGAAPSFTDGDLAPHNWIQSRNGRILKFGGLAHDLDHTLVGSQPLHWAVAGALIESQADEETVMLLCSHMSRNGIDLRPSALNFFCAAYAAFRVGQTSICAQWEPISSAEWMRLKQANRYYRFKLASLLWQSGQLEP